MPSFEDFPGELKNRIYGHATEKSSPPVVISYQSPRNNSHNARSIRKVQFFGLTQICRLIHFNNTSLQVVSRSSYSKMCSDHHLSASLSSSLSTSSVYRWSYWYYYVEFRKVKRIGILSLLVGKALLPNLTNSCTICKQTWLYNWGIAYTTYVKIEGREEMKHWL
jgi:hypothetical protein